MALPELSGQLQEWSNMFMIILRSKIVRVIENKKADHGYCKESCKFLNPEEFHIVLFSFQ